MQSIIGSQYKNLIIKQINDAKTSIKIIMFDWRWYSDDPANPVQLLNQSIVRAVRRGVDVRAVVNSDKISTILKSVGIQAKKPTTSNLIHAKLVIIDDKIIIVGSHNFSNMAFEHNYEASTLFDDAEIAKEYINFFNNLWQL